MFGVVIRYIFENYIAKTSSLNRIIFHYVKGMSIGYYVAVRAIVCLFLWIKRHVNRSEGHQFAAENMALTKSCAGPFVNEYENKGKLFFDRLSNGKESLNQRVNIVD